MLAVRPAPLQIPMGWFFDSQSLQSLTDALRCAGRTSAKQSLMADPIKASWSDATVELLLQYEAAIEKNLPNRVELASYTRVFNQFLKAALFTALTGWLLRGYTSKVAFALLCSHCSVLRYVVLAPGVQAFDIRLGRIDSMVRGHRGCLLMGHRKSFSTVALSADQLEDALSC